MVKGFIKSMIVLCMSIFLFVPNGFANGVVVEEDSIYSYKSVDGDVVFSTIYSGSFRRAVEFFKVYPHDGSDPRYYLYIYAHEKGFQQKEQINMIAIVNGKEFDLGPNMIKDKFDREDGTFRRVYEIPEAMLTELGDDMQMICKFSVLGTEIKQDKIAKSHVNKWNDVRKMVKSDYVRNGLVTKEAARKMASLDGNLEVYLPGAVSKNVLRAVLFTIKEDKDKRYDYGKVYVQFKEEEKENDIMSFVDYKGDTFITFVAYPYKEGTHLKMLKNRILYTSSSVRKGAFGPVYSAGSSQLADFTLGKDGNGIVDMRSYWQIRLATWDKMFLGIYKEFADTAYYGIEYEVNRSDNKEEGNIFTVKNVEANWQELYPEVKAGYRLISVDGESVDKLRKEEVDYRLVQKKDSAKFIFANEKGNEIEVVLKPEIITGKADGKMDYVQYFEKLDKPVKLRLDYQRVNDAELAYGYVFMKKEDKKE